MCLGALVGERERERERQQAYLCQKRNLQQVTAARLDTNRLDSQVEKL